MSSINNVLDGVRDFFSGFPVMLRGKGPFLLGGMIAVAAIFLVSLGCLFLISYLIIHYFVGADLSFMTEAMLSINLGIIIFIGISLTIIGSIFNRILKDTQRIGKIMHAIASSVFVVIAGTLIPLSVYNLHKSFYFQPLLGATVIFLALLLIYAAIDKGFEHVYPKKSKKWGHGLVIMTALIFYYLPAVGYMRNDYYNTETGKSKVYITPSTGKIWRSKPSELVFDPTTGEKIVVANNEQIKKADEKKFKLSNLFKKSPATSNQQATVKDYIVYPRGQHTFILKAGEITEKRIDYPSGTYPSIESINNSFKFIYPDGRIIEAWKIKKMPESGYRIQAVSDEKIVLKIR